MLYRILGQKKKDKWSLVIPISCLVITLLIPYKSGDGLIDFFSGALSSAPKIATFLAFASLVMAIGCIILYFIDIKFGKDEEEK